MIVQENKNSKNNSKLFNQEIDNEIQFSHLDEGLGFHKNERDHKVVINSFIHSDERKKRDKSQQKRIYGTNVPYKNRISPATPIEKKQNPLISQEKKLLPPPPVYLQFAAYLVDILIIFSLTFGMLTLFSFLSPDKLNYQFFLAQKDLEAITLLCLLCILYYLAYFTFLGPRNTIGQDLFNIKTLHTSGREPLFYQCFIRSVVTLASISVLFLPLLWGLQDKLSETKLQQK